MKKTIDFWRIKLYNGVSETFDIMPPQIFLSLAVMWGIIIYWWYIYDWGYRMEAQIFGMPVSAFVAIVSLVGLILTVALSARSGNKVTRDSAKEINQKQNELSEKVSREHSLLSKDSAVLLEKAKNTAASASFVENWVHGEMERSANFRKNTEKKLEAMSAEQLDVNTKVRDVATALNDWQRTKIENMELKRRNAELSKQNEVLRRENNDLRASSNSGFGGRSR